MTDFLSGIGDAIGGAAGAAFDFVKPTTDRRGAGFSFSDLLNTAADVGRNSLVGAVSGFDDVLRSDASWKQKLFVGGMIGAGIGGAALGARQLAAQRKMERQFTQVNPAMVSRTSDQAIGLGLAPRWRPDALEERQVVKQHPGIRARSVPTLAAGDAEATARSLVSERVAAQPERLYHSVALVQTYADGLEELAPEARLAAAQLDFAKVDTIIDNNLIRSVAADRAGKGPGFMNAELKSLWGQFKDSPEAMADEDKLKLLSFVRQIGDATDVIQEPDLTFNVVDRVTGVYLTDQGAVLNIQSPVWDRASTLADAEVRSARLKQLNVRALAGRGKELFDRLLDMGLDDQARRARGEGGILPKPLEIGTGWYPKAGQQIDDALRSVQARIPWLSKEKLTAAVSLTSEAEKWEGNIALAAKALEVANTPEVMDEGFQAWLKAGGTSADGSAYGKTMKRLHDQAKKGNQLSERDFAKVLRLASESAEEVFASTQGRKQKSFYLNLMGDRSVVTVDRHQHDAFFGVATSSDFKILEQKDLDDSVYDLIQDTVFQIADERPDLSPSDIQGVIWEVWRILKDDHLHHTNRPWQTGNPFRLMEADGSENIVFEALTGEYSGGLRDALAAKGSNIPYIIGPSKEGLYSMPDETASFVAPVTRESAQKMRHLQPAIAERPGVAHWAPSRARRTNDLEARLAQFDSELDGHVTETWANGVWPNGHPALSPGDTIMIEVPTGTNPAKDLAKFGQVESPLGPGKRSMPVTMNRATPPDGVQTVTLQQFADARRAWEERMSAEGKLREFGTSPMPDDLLEWKDHKLFLNEQGTAGFAISPDGDLQQVFNGGRKGLGEEMIEYAITQGAKTLDAYDDGLPDFYRRFGFSETQRDAWDPQYDKQGRPTGPDIVYMALDPEVARSTRRTTKVALKVNPQEARRLHEIADEIEASGYGVDVIYSAGPAPAGWSTVREHIYEDQVSTAVVRTADNEIDSYHGVHGWVRKDTAKLLPKKHVDGSRARKPVNVQRMENGAVVFDNTAAFVPLYTVERDGLSALQIIANDFPTSKQEVVHGLVLDTTGPIPTLRHTFADDKIGSPAYAVYRDGRIVVNVPSKNDLGLKGDGASQIFDLQEASQIKDTLLEMGVPPEKVQIRVGSDAIDTELFQPKAVKPTQTTVHGYQVPTLKRTTSPLPEYQTRFKLDVDPGWRDSNGTLHRVPPEFFAEIDPVLEMFYDRHKEMARVVDFRKLGFSEAMAAEDWDPSSVTAWAAHGDGGSEIIFNSRFIQDPQSFFADAGEGHFASGNSPASLIAHELGHLMHYAVEHSFRTKKEAEAWNRDVVRSLFKKVGKKGIQAQLSNYGASNVKEFIAEAISEAMLSPAPRQLATQVYNLVQDQFAKNTEVKRTTALYGWRKAS
jgi:hypothetical protein